MVTDTTSFQPVIDSYNACGIFDIESDISFFRTQKKRVQIASKWRLLTQLEDLP
jgi:hypothetical protein